MVIDYIAIILCLARIVFDITILSLAAYNRKKKNKKTQRQMEKLVPIFRVLNCITGSLLVLFLILSRVTNGN